MPIIEILVSVGDTVAAEDPLVTLESDKATMDVPAPIAGVVKEILVSARRPVSQGSPLMTIGRRGRRSTASRAGGRGRGWRRRPRPSASGRDRPPEAAHAEAPARPSSGSAPPNRPPAEPG